MLQSFMYKKNNNVNSDDDHHHITITPEEEENDGPDVRKETAVAPSDSFNPTFYNPFEVKHRQRISREQFKKLEKAFIDNPKPNSKIRQKLAENVSMTPRGVQVWFQNRRAKAKQQKEQKEKKRKSENNLDDMSNSQDVNTPIILSAYNMIHSRSQSSSSSISYSDSIPTSCYIAVADNSGHNDIRDNSKHSIQIKNLLPIDQSSLIPVTTFAPSQTWQSDASTVTGADEEDLKLNQSPSTIQMNSANISLNSNGDLNKNLWWVDNNNSDTMTSVLNQQLNLPVSSEIPINSTIIDKTNTFINNNKQGEQFLDAWTFIDGLSASSTSNVPYQPHFNNIQKSDNFLLPGTFKSDTVKMLNSTTTNEKQVQNTTRYLGNEMMYNRNVADWIQTVSLAQNNHMDEDLMLDKILTTSNNNTSKQQYSLHSFVPFQQDQTYWTE